MTPLDGVRVLDFTRQMAGPYGTQFLADYGADVIKVESVPNGDPTRNIGVDFVNGESALFLNWNHSKRGIALDLREPRGLEVAHRLARSADVVVENYRPGVAETIGIGYEELAAINPRLVYLSLTAFGRTGPLAPYPGTDPVVQAMSGVMSLTGEADGDPLLVGIPVADFTASMLCSQGIMLALLARERTGRGQRVDVSMLLGLVSALTTRLASHWASGETPGRHGGAHSVVVPYEVFGASDGHVVAGVWGGDGWSAFCRAMELEHLTDDERFATNPDRVARRLELRAILAAEFAQHTVDHWEERFNATGALFGRVLTVPEVLAHPQVTQSEVVTTVDHPIAGTIPQLGPVISLSDTPGRAPMAPPLLGQHTIEVLEELGYGAGEIAALVDDGVARRAETGEKAGAPAHG